MTRVLVINTVKFHVNGMSNVIMGLYENIKDQNFRFDFVVCEEIDPKYKKIIEENDDRIFILNHRNKNFLKYIKSLSIIIKKGSYDIIHIHGNSATMSFELAAAQISGLKAKRIVHAHNTACRHTFLNKLLYGYFIRHSDYRIACSRAAGEWLYKENKYYVFNNGIDEKKFRFDPTMRDTHRLDLGINDKFVILHVGRFNQQKNHKFLLKVFKSVLQEESDAILRLVGDGTLMNDIKDCVKDMEIQEHVMFVGVTDEPEIEYNIADVFVLPSLYESFGLVNVEAQCMGLPCIISDTVPREIAITNQVSFVSLNADPSVWSKTILQYKTAERKDNREFVIANGYSLWKEAQKFKHFIMKITESESDRS